MIKFQDIHHIFIKWRKLSKCFCKHKTKSYNKSTLVLFRKPWKFSGLHVKSLQIYQRGNNAFPPSLLFVSLKEFIRCYLLHLVTSCNTFQYIIILYLDSDRTIKKIQPSTKTLFFSKSTFYVNSYIFSSNLYKKII